MRDVAFSDSSPPASWHAGFVHMCVKKRAAICKSECVCTCVDLWWIMSVFLLTAVEQGKIILLKII